MFRHFSNRIGFFSWEMTRTEPVDVCVVGNFSLDHIRLPSAPEPYTVLGGAVTFVSIITRHLGGSAAVISKVGDDFPQAYLQRLVNEGIDVSAVMKATEEMTTSFELSYSADFSSRTLRLRQAGSLIRPDDLPSFIQAKTLHIAPIAAEIGFDLVQALSTRSRCLSIDPQGMARSFDKKGYVSATAQLDKRILPLVTVFKSSVEEIKLLTGFEDPNSAIRAIHDYGPEIVIVTDGAKGSVLSHQNTMTHVPACQSRRVVDPTGAGDVYIGAFLTEFTRKKEPLWCACVGSAAASLVVEDVGSRFFGGKSEIYSRAKVIYEKLL